jgi:AI-2 transport protein TqsA
VSTVPTAETAATPGGPVSPDGHTAGTAGIPRALVVLLGAAATVVVLAGVQAIAWLVGPAFLALVIVIAVAPVQTRLRRRGRPGWLSTLVVVLLVYGVILGLGLGVVFSVARLATELPRYTSQADGLLTGLSAQLAALGVGREQVQAALSSLDLSKLGGVFTALLESVAGLASNLVFLLALLLFLGVESGGVGHRLAAIGVDRPKITVALGRFAWGTRRYLLVTTVFGLIVAVLDSIALALLGIPLALTWGLLSFITNYIPNVGFVIVVVPPALLGLLTGGPRLMVVVLVVYSVLNFVVQSLIQPRFIGDAVGLSVTVTFLALVFWAWLLGPLGAILAIPLTLLAKALLVDIDPRAGWADALLRATGRDSGTKVVGAGAGTASAREPDSSGPGEAAASSGRDAGAGSCTGPDRRREQ